jgi:hypothetical protein
VIGLLQFMKGIGYEFNAKTCAHAAGAGHLETLKFLHEDMDCEWDAETYAEAARGGHTACFEYVKSFHNYFLF